MRFKSASYRGTDGNTNFSRSFNAQRAEQSGRMPATRAAKAWGFKSATTLKEWVDSSEWHHVGKYATIVDYYDVESWLVECESEELSVFFGLPKALTKWGKQNLFAPLVKAIIKKQLASENASVTSLRFKAGYYSSHRPNLPSRTSPKKS